ncbi:MAG: hypothetical protein ACP5IE_01310 [Infirmifilum sp.]
MILISVGGLCPARWAMFVVFTSALLSRPKSCTCIASQWIYPKVLLDYGKALNDIDVMLGGLEEYRSRIEGFLEEWEAEKIY